MKRSPLKRKTPLRKRAKVKIYRKVKVPRGYMSLRNQAWDLMSEYVRRRDKGVCFTCGVVKDWKEVHAGHFHHNCMDFNERNIHAQCSRCNTHLHGNLDSYAIKLTRKYGPNILEELDRAKAEEKPLLYDDIPALIKSLILKVEKLKTIN